MLIFCGFTHFFHAQNLFSQGLLIQSPEGRCRAYPVGAQLFLLYIIWVKKRIRHFQNHYSTVTFFSLENILSPEWRCRIYLVRFQLLLLIHYLGQETYMTLSNMRLGEAFLKPWRCLSPERRCKAYPVGVQLFLLVFYFGLGYVLWKKSHPSIVIFAEFFPRKSYCWGSCLMGRVGRDGWDGWDGSDGNEKCPLNFFILCGYIDYVYLYLYTK